jgi:hypothetical protein
MKRIFFVILFLLIAFSAKRVEAAPPMALGDADVVPYRHWEFWLTFSYKELKDDKIYKVPTFEMIYGLLPRLELGVEGTYIIEDSDGHKTDGLECVVIQPKFLLAAEGESRPAVALSLQYELPTDEEKDTLCWSDAVWAAGLAAQKHFGKTLVVTQVKYFTNRHLFEKKWRYGFDVIHSVTDKLKLLAEIYAHNFSHTDKRNEVNFRLGFKYNMTDNLKLYFAAGRSLLAVEENRPLFESTGGIMLEF